MRHIRLWVFVFIYGFIVCGGLIALAVTSIILNKRISRDSSAILLQNALERSQQTMERRITEFALNGQNVATAIARSGFNVTASETANLTSFETIWRELDISSVSISSLISAYVMWRTDLNDVDVDGQNWWATGCSQLRNSCYVMNATSNTWTEVPIDEENRSYDFDEAVVYPFQPTFHTQREDFLNKNNVDLQLGLFSPVYITYTDFTQFQKCNGKYVLQRIAYYFCMQNLGSGGTDNNEAIQQCSYVLGLEAEFTVLIPPRLVAITNSSSSYVLSQYVKDETGGACDPPSGIQSIVNEYKQNCPLEVNVSDCNNVFNYKSSQVVTVVSVRYRRELYVLSVDLTAKDFFFYLAQRVIRISVIVSVIIIVFVICLSTFVLFSIVLPINRICYGMRMASQLSSNDHIGNVKRYTWIAEMALLYSSYKNLRKALLDLKAFVPQGLFIAPAPGTMATDSLLNILMGNNDPQQHYNNNNNNMENKITEDAYYAQNEELAEDVEYNKRRQNGNNGSSSSSSSSSSSDENNNNNNINEEYSDKNNNNYSETNINGDVIRSNLDINKNWDSESNESNRSASYSNATGFVAASSSPHNNNKNNKNSSRSRKGNGTNKNKRRYVDLWGDELDASEHTVQYDASESMRSTTATQNNELLSSYNNYSNFNKYNNNNLSFDYLDMSSHHINNNNQFGVNKRKRQGVQNTYLDPYQTDWNKIKTPTTNTTRSLNNKNINLNGNINNNNNNNLIVYDNHERSIDLTQPGEHTPLPSTLLHSVQTSPFINNNLQINNNYNNINNLYSDPGNSNNYVEMTSYTNANSQTHLLNGKKNVSFLASGYGMKSIESDNLNQLMTSDRQQDKNSNYKFSNSLNSININNLNNNNVVLQPAQSVAFKHQIPFSQLAPRNGTNQIPTLSSEKFFYNNDEPPYNNNNNYKNNGMSKARNSINRGHGVKNLESAVFVDVHDDDNELINNNNNNNKMERKITSSGQQYSNRYGPSTPESYWSHQQHQQQQIIDEENNINSNMNNNNNNRHYHNNNTFFASITSFQSNSQTNESNSFTNVSKGMRLAAYERNYNTFRSVNCSMLTIAMEFRYANTHSLTNEVATLMNISVFEILKWGGIIELLRPNLIVATFGAHHQLPQNAPLATACAIVIIRRIPPAQRPRTRLYVDSGKFFVGNCGAHHRISPVVFGDRFDFAINVIRHELCAGRVLVTDSIAVYLPQDFLCPVDYIMTLFNKNHGIQLFQVIDRVRSRPPQFMDKVNRFRAAYANAVSGQYESAISILRNGAVHDNELGFQFLTALTYLASLHPRRPRYCRFQLPPFEPLGVEPRNTTMKYQFAKMRLNEIDQAASTEVIHFGFDNDDDDTNNNVDGVNARNTRNSINNDLNNNNVDNVFGDVSSINNQNALQKNPPESVFESESLHNTLIEPTHTKEVIQTYNVNNNNNDYNNVINRIEQTTSKDKKDELNRLHSEYDDALSDGNEMNVSATKSPRASIGKQESNKKNSNNPNLGNNNVKEEFENKAKNLNETNLVDLQSINSNYNNKQLEEEEINNLDQKKSLRRQRRRRESLTRMRNSLQSNTSSSSNKSTNEETELTKRNSTNEFINNNEKKEKKDVNSDNKNDNDKGEYEKDIRKMSNVDTALVMSNLLPRSLHSASPLSAPLPSQSYLTDFEYDNNTNGQSYNNDINNVALEGFDDLPLTFMDHHNEVWHRIKTPIGAGAFAEVYKAISSNTGEIIAVKCINLTASHTSISDVVREVNISCKLFNEHIVNYTDWVHHNNYVLLLMEYMSGGSLYNILSAFPHGIPLKLARRYASDALKGLAYLHKHKFVHADFKPQNMLLSSEGLCRISDFGSSVKKAHAMQFAHDVFKLRGTALYMSPEVAAGHPPTMQSDLFSFGISLYEILTGKLPWMKVKRKPESPNNNNKTQGTSEKENINLPKENTLKANQNGTSEVHSEKTNETINVNTNTNSDTTNDHYDQLVTLEDLGEMSEMRFLQGLANGTVVARLRHHNVLTPEAVNLISRCLQVDPAQRPEAFDLIDHPFFWAEEYVKELEKVGFN